MLKLLVIMQCVCVLHLAHTVWECVKGLSVLCYLRVSPVKVRVYILLSYTLLMHNHLSGSVCDEDHCGYRCMGECDCEVHGECQSNCECECEDGYEGSHCESGISTVHYVLNEYYEGMVAGQV